LFAVSEHVPILVLALANNMLARGKRKLEQGRNEEGFQGTGNGEDAGGEDGEGRIEGEGEGWCQPCAALRFTRKQYASNTQVCLVRSVSTTHECIHTTIQHFILQTLPSSSPSNSLVLFYTSELYQKSLWQFRGTFYSQIKSICLNCIIARISHFLFFYNKIFQLFRLIYLMWFG
jgi:hypothetical protein